MRQREISMIVVKELKTMADGLQLLACSLDGNIQSEIEAEERAKASKEARVATMGMPIQTHFEREEKVLRYMQGKLDGIFQLFSLERDAPPIFNFGDRGGR